MLYRALRNLSNGVRLGNLTSLPGLSAADIQKLEKVGAVSQVSAPPLDVLPEWKERAKLLLPLGIRRVDELIEADSGVLGSAFQMTDAEVAALKGEAAGVLVVKEFS